MDTFKEVALKGDVAQAMRILEEKLIGEDTADAGDVYAEVLRFILSEDRSNVSLLSAVVSSINENPDALCYFEEEDGEAAKDFILSTSSDVDKELLKLLSQINVHVEWYEEDIPALFMLGDENLRIVLSAHPITSDVTQKLREMEDESIDKHTEGLITDDGYQADISTLNPMREYVQWTDIIEYRRIFSTCKAWRLRPSPLILASLAPEAHQPMSMNASWRGLRRIC